LAARRTRFNNVFTDEFLFHYGSFVVFPGLRDEAFYIVRMLAQAVLHARRPAGCLLPGRAGSGGRDTDDQRRCRARPASTAASTPSRSRAASRRPDKPLAELKDAVSFRTDELARWLAPLTPDALAPLVQDLPAPVDADVPPMTVLHRPLARGGDRYLVAAPHFLLPALIHAALELARDLDVLGLVAERFRDAVYGSVLQSASYLGWDEIDAALPELEGLRAHESVFVFDRDKATRSGCRTRTRLSR
jgi:hypothetical protein